MLSERVKKISASPTLSLAAKAKALKAEGKDVISLTVGEPDWNTFDSVVEVAVKSIKDGNTKYVPSSGIPSLRQGIAKNYKDNFNTKYETENVTVSTGAKFILFSAMQAVVNPGDEVIIPSPYWVSYPEMVKLAGGIPVVIECGREDNFKLKPEKLKAAISDKTKLLLLNSPSNPTGMVYSSEELKAVSEVLMENSHVAILSDDIYNLLVFNERGLAPHILEVAPELEERCICVNGASKAYSMTGWRVGWALGPKDVIAAMSKYQSQSVSCAAGFAQEASLYALEHSEEEIKKSIKLLEQRKNKLSQKLNAIDGINVEEPEGAFYIWLNIEDCLGKSYEGEKLSSSSDFSTKLLSDKLLATVPGDAFGLEGYLRLSYALSEERGLEACDRLKDFCSKLK